MHLDSNGLVRVTVGHVSCRAISHGWTTFLYGGLWGIRVMWGINGGIWFWWGEGFGGATQVWCPQYSNLIRDRITKYVSVLKLIRKSCPSGGSGFTLCPMSRHKIYQTGGWGWGGIAKNLMHPSPPHHQIILLDQDTVGPEWHLVEIWLATCLPLA